MYNMGKIDQVIRFLVGFVMLTVGILFNMAFVGTMGAIFMALSLIGNCPFYCMLKIDTCKVKCKETRNDS